MTDKATPSFQFVPLHIPEIKNADAKALNEAITKAIDPNPPRDTKPYTKTLPDGTIVTRR